MLTEEIKKNLDVNIDIPSDYYKSFYDSAENAYSVIAHSPERVFTIKRISNKEISLKDMINIRNSIGKTHWDGDVIDAGFVKLEIDTLEYHGRKATEIRGVWSNPEMNYGGPFITRFIEDDTSILMLDGHIYLPGDRKFFKLMETGAIMNTLKISPEQSMHLAVVPPMQ